MDEAPTGEAEDRSRKDGLAAMAILLLTIVFVVVVLVAII